MANYHDNVKKRIKSSNESMFMSAYVHLDIEFGDENTMNAKKNKLEEMSNMIANIVHRDVETDVLLRKGSVIMETVTSGNLHSLLSPKNMKAIGVVIVENPAESLLTCDAIREALSILIKDVDEATTFLSMYARHVFQARPRDVMRTEARTGVVGNLKRFMDACDVARNEELLALKRKNAMERAFNQLETILDLSKNKDDQELMIKYTKRELEIISRIQITNQKNKELEYVKDFNKCLSACRKMIKKN